jgi:dihydrofolate synthase/folylpolyglutamate synthase
VPGRIEIVSRDPLVVLDGAHNVAGAQALARAVAEELWRGADTVAVVGMLHGRDPSAMLDALAPAGVRTVVACPAPSPRTLPASDIADAARALGLRALVTDTVGDAVTLALGEVPPDGMLLVLGSLYVVAEARTRFVSSTEMADPR